MGDCAAAAKTQRTNDGAERIGNRFRAVAKLGLGYFTHPQVLLDLPNYDQRPHGNEEPVNEEAAASKVHQEKASNFKSQASGKLQIPTSELQNRWRSADFPFRSNVRQLTTPGVQQWRPCIRRLLRTGKSALRPSIR